MTTEAPSADAIADLKAALDAAEALSGRADLAMTGEGWDMRGGSRSKVRMNGRDLPDRWPAWRVKTGQAVPNGGLPTAQLVYHLSKRHQDGTPVFALEQPGGTFPKPIDETCEFCLERGVRKQFYTRVALGVHLRAKHPDEYAFMQDERKPQSSVIEEVMKMNSGQRTALRALLSQEESNGREETPCPDCGKPVKKLAPHRRFCPANQKAAV